MFWLAGLGVGLLWFMQRVRWHRCSGKGMDGTSVCVEIESWTKEKYSYNTYSSRKSKYSKNKIPKGK